MTPLFEIRSYDGHVYNSVENPAVVFDKNCGTLLKIGERDDMQAYFDRIQKVYRAGGVPEMADDMVFMDLPADQEVIDRVFQTIDYVGVLYKNMLKEMAKSE